MESLIRINLSAIWCLNIDGLVQYCRISIAKALEILQSFIKPSICHAVTQILLPWILHQMLRISVMKFNLEIWSQITVYLNEWSQLPGTHFTKAGVTLTSAGISNHIPSKSWDEITYPFSKFNTCSIKVWKWISNSILFFIMYVMTFQCLDLNKSML